MKRIYAVTMVKNEGDIIESFCRHTASFCDGILICDDGSADGTGEIIDRLAGEGLPLIRFNNVNSIGYYQDLIINRLARTAAESCGADLILPLDADEFLHADGGNPRGILEGLSAAEAYSLNWPFYLPGAAPDDNGVFLPSRFDEYIDQPLIKKIIVGAELLKNPNNRISIGNQVLYTSGSGAYRNAQLLDSLTLAHYPVRSAEQVTVKAVNGWANAMCMRKTGNVAENLGEMYRSIKQHGIPDAKQLREFAMSYLYGYKESLPVLRYRLQSNITLRYTDYESIRRNFLNIILSNYERIIDVLMNRGSAYSIEESLKNKTHPLPFRDENAP